MPSASPIASPADATDASVEALEAAFALPAVDPHAAFAGATVAAPRPSLVRNPDAALVADSVRAPLDSIELVTLALFALVAVGSAVLVALALLG